MYVRPGQPLDDVVSNLYDRIGQPALTDAKLKLTVDGMEGRTRQLYPSEMYDLFSGDQIVIVGRYRKPGKLKIKLTGDFLGESQEFVYEHELPKQTGSGKNMFVERLWATRRIGQIIDEIDLNGENKEAVDELIKLSKRHGILTPYTAYLAEERTDLNDMVGARRMTGSNLQGLDKESGVSAFRQRDFKGKLRSTKRASNSLAENADMMMEMDMSMDMGMNDMMSSGMSSPMPAASAAGQALGGRGGGRSSGNVNKPQVAQRIAQQREAIKRIGTKTFYLRAGRYVDSDATKEQIESAKTIEQFSDEYFALLKDLDDESKTYLAQEKEILVVINDTTYIIKAPAE